MRPVGSFEMWILVIRPPPYFAEVYGRGIEDVYSDVQIIITAKYVNYFLFNSDTRLQTFDTRLLNMKLTLAMPPSPYLSIILR
jgi:hypothetical protein